MSDRIKKSWKVLRSIEIYTGDYCVDFFVREDGSYGFEEFRRDSEDMGRWGRINYFSILSFLSVEEALNEAMNRVAWLNEDLYSHLPTIS
jgi:hypothetical protein